MIRHADAFEVLPTLEPRSFDTVLMCLWSSPSAEEIDALLEHSLRVARHNVVIETVGQREYFKICSRSEAIGLDTIVWAKNNRTCHLNAGRKPADELEMIAVLRQPRSFYRSIVTYVDRFSHGGGVKNTERTRLLGNIWHGPSARYTMPKLDLTDIPQPTWLVEQLLYCYTPDGGSVLEIGAGCGSGWRAARRLGFEYLGLEASTRMITSAERWMATSPVEPVLDKAAYMTDQVTRNHNHYCQLQARVQRSA